AQLERLEELVEKKRRIFFWYRDSLSKWNRGMLNPDIPGLYNSYWMTTVVLDSDLGLKKEQLGPHLRAQGIDVRPVYYPQSTMAAFRDRGEAAVARKRNKIAYALTPHGVNLPSALSLERADVDRVSERLQAAVAAFLISQ